MIASPQRAPRLERLAILLVLLFALLSAIGLRAYQLSSKSMLSHDEAISYLAATGHQGTYARTIDQNITNASEISERMSGRWVKASAWKSLLEIDRFVPSQTIRHDLAHYDIHPPLYFWMLHFWLWIVGTEVWSGASLNIILALGTFSALYGLARYVLKSSFYASAVVLVWSLSSEVIAVSAQARPYDLLALLSVLLVWQTLRILHLGLSITPLNGSLLATTIAVGLLTHYHFAIVIVACGLLFVVNARRLPRKRLVLSVASVSIGVLIAVVVHPDFWVSFVRQQNQAQPFTFSDVVYRVETSIDALLRFFGWRPWWATRLEPLGIWAVVLVCSAIGAVLCLVSRILERQIGLSFRERFVVFYFVLTFGAILFLYVGSFSPKHAMGGRYLAMVWPFAAFVPLLAIKTIMKSMTTKTVVTNRLVGLLSIAYAVLALLPFRLDEIGMTDTRESPLLVTMKGAPSVVFDNTARGVLLPLVHVLPDETRVFAASQAELLKTPSKWLSDLSSGDLFVSALSYQSTKDGLTLLLGEIYQVYATKPVVSGGAIVAFRILPPSSSRSGTSSQAP